MDINTRNYPSSILSDRGEYNLLITYPEIKKNIINKLSNTKNDKYITKYQNENIVNSINEYCKLPIYSNLSKYTTINSINYLFFHLRNAIYVKIRNNKVVEFLPFANAFYRNNWSHNIKLDESKNVHEYIQYKKKYYKVYQKYLLDKERWWCNSVIINNDDRKDIWGTHSLDIYKDILDETCKNKKINDIDFFINKRDHPMLKKDLTEPYDNLFPAKKKLEGIYLNQHYTPILSPYVDNEFADIPYIIPDDWKLCQEDYEYKIKNDIKWEDKVNTAFFRGSATGHTDICDNQRLQISKLNQEWNGRDNLLDAGIVSLNNKDKIDTNLTVKFIKKDEQNIKLLNRIPMNEQIKYKYILSIAGHSGGVNRISWILQSGCLWLKIKPLKIIKATESWYSPLLKKDIHYIEIKEDLSDLEEKILWCRENDKECQDISNNAKQLYEKYFNKNQLINYSELVLNSISNNFK